MAVVRPSCTDPEDSANTVQHAASIISMPSWMSTAVALTVFDDHMSLSINA